MKNITVTVDDETYRCARIRAAELDTSVSAMVREYLRLLSVRQTEEARAETKGERRGRLLREVVEDFDARGWGCGPRRTCRARSCTSAPLRRSRRRRRTAAHGIAAGVPRKGPP